MAPNIHLLMMVYRGDRHWQPALESVERSRHLFDRLIVSFDGPNRSELVSYLGNRWPAEFTTTVLKTPSEMTWSEHIQWLGIQPEIADLDSNDFLMIMSEDDIIQTHPLQQALEQTVQSGKVVLFGPWAGADDKDRFDPSQTDRPTLTRTPLIARRLAKLSRVAHITSVAGVTMPVTAFRRYVALHGPYGVPPIIGGVRAEYFMASQSCVEALIEAPVPFIVVQRHDAQGSRGIVRSDWVRDECLYQLWVLTDPKFLPGWDRLMALLRFAKRLSQNPRVLRHLVSAMRIFNGVRSDLPITRTASRGTD